MPAPVLAPRDRSQRQLTAAQVGLDLTSVVDPIGVVLTLDGRRYTAVRVRAEAGHVRIVWRGHCETCGQPFEVELDRRSLAGLPRRCADHRGARGSAK